jgi:hypothetical protein
MILFPNKDILTQEIQSWQGFAETLRSEDRKVFSQMLNDCYQLDEAINTKGEYFSTESILMGLVFVQHKIINWLINSNSKDI